jgi:hypothetical protein
LIPTKRVWNVIVLIVAHTLLALRQEHASLIVMNATDNAR